MTDSTARTPPGQYVTERFPVLHVGTVPEVDPSDWDLVVDGLVDQELRFGFDEFRALPTASMVADIHCVTKWSLLDTSWEGVPVSELLDRAGVADGASHAIVHAEHGFTSNLALDDLHRAGNLLAYRYDGEELSADHGWPLRLVVPHLYFWKSVKWVRRIELTDHDEPGFWERNGYHMRGDPWQEQRYWGD